MVILINAQGFEKLKGLVEEWDGSVPAPTRYNLRLFADKDTYEAMDDLARVQNKNAHQLAMEIIRNYVAAHK